MSVTALDGTATDEWWVQNVSKQASVAHSRNSREDFLEGQRDNTKASVGIAGIPHEIRIWFLPNTGRESSASTYKYRDLLLHEQTRLCYSLSVQRA
jgi:hypothetical protein